MNIFEKLVHYNAIKTPKYPIFTFIKCLFSFGSIKDNSICWFSAKFWDIHDYKINQGGDGYPTHFFEYTCPNCLTKFTI